MTHMYFNDVEDANKELAAMDARVQAAQVLILQQAITIKKLENLVQAMREEREESCSGPE